MAVLMIGMTAFLFLLDLMIKESIEKNVDVSEERELAGGKILIRKVYNKGMLLHFMDQRPRAVKSITAALGIFIIVYDIFLLFVKKRFLEKVGMVFLTGGAFSNIYDRLARGKVIDYIGFQTKNKAFTRVTFNLGDFFILLGAILALLSGRKR